LPMPSSTLHQHQRQTFLSLDELDCRLSGLRKYPKKETFCVLESRLLHSCGWLRRIANKLRSSAPLLHGIASVRLPERLIADLTFDVLLLPLFLRFPSWVYYGLV
jgi:hypothetical protein